MYLYGNTGCNETKIKSFIYGLSPKIPQIPVKKEPKPVKTEPKVEKCAFMEQCIKKSFIQKEMR